MAVKSVIDIEVNDTAFQKFAETFKRYKEELAKTPDAWKEVGKHTEQTSVSFEGLVAALLAQAEFAHVLAQDNEKIEISTEKQARSWRDMSRSSHQFAANLLSATRSLVRWSALTGAISGLLGVGSIFGLERFAFAAGGMRRSGLGLGMSPGEQRAFGLNYGRLVEPAGFLSGVNESLHDVSKLSSLYGAGLSSADIQGRSTAQVAAALIPALKRIADQTPDAMLGNVLAARHLDQFISLEDFQRIKATPAGELSSYGSAYRRDIERLDLTKAQQKAWQDLQVQLTRAGESIETTFIRGLTPLAKPLEDLSRSFMHLVEVFMKAASEQGWLERFGRGMEWVAQKLDDGSFKQGLTDFINNISALGSLIGRVAHLWGGDGSAGSYRLSDAPLFGGTPSGYENWGYIPGMNGAPPRRDPVDPVKNDLRWAIPRGTTDALWAIESSRGKNATRSEAGAEGDFQFLPDTWKIYGHGRDVNNPGAAADAAGEYFQHLYYRFGRDPAKAAAGYFAGEEAVAGAVSQYGSKWREHMGPKTQEYITKFMSMLTGKQAMNGQGRVRIDIYNNTGGSAIVAASQVA